MNGFTWRGWRAMFWKEWRENVLWAALASLGLLLGIGNNVTVKVSAVHYVAKDFLEFWNGFDLAMSIGPLIVAAGLPLLQIFTEQRRDQWAFLIHRPASRSALFWGKAGAGLSLYLMATLVPMILAGGWAATPGNMAAPFDLHVFAAGFRAILSGALVYFGAMLTALRPARWYGSRGVPLILAGLCAFVISGGISLWFLLPLSVLFIAASWSAFLGDGEDARQPLWGKVSLRVTLYAGMLGVCVGAVALADLAYHTVRPQERQATTESFGVVRPNHIVRETFTRLQPASVGYSLTDLRGVDGREYPISVRPSGGEERLVSGSTLMGGDPDWDRAEPRRVIPLDTYQEQTEPRLNWFYVTSQHWIEVYSRSSRRLIGRFGPDGFRSVTQGLPRPFADTPLSLADYQQPDLFAFHHQIYRLSAFGAAGRFLPIEERRLTLLYQSLPASEILSVTPSTKLEPTASLAYVVTATDGIRLLGGDGSLRAFLPWERGRNGVNTLVDVGIVQRIDKSSPNPDHYFFWIWPFERTNTPPTAVVIEVSGQGKILQRVQITRSSAPIHSDTPWYGIAAPLVASSIAASSVSGSDPSAGRTLIVICVVTAVLCALLAWRIALRCGAPRSTQILWALSCLLLGLPALLTLVALRPWPARAICPECGKPRVVTYQCCEHCGAAFSPPPRDGTEIFEEPESAVRAA